MVQHSTDPAAGSTPERRGSSPAEQRERSITWAPRAAGASPWPSCRGPRARRAAPAAAAAAAPPRRRRAPSARAGGPRAPATCSPGRRRRSWLLPQLLRHRSTSRLSASATNKPCR
ncbi:hypothetical protein GQ55_1G043700 [Panicum hallii var. hallii]|uniref:Uncharacterized protein n=1 Tax=Panicum hallii var. hallii TaxID=1504633 RepID=A0A2T7F268_9POAL|nr:hypothetical protein GQ55_1G043700 [Panicum hallii var. hallii]